jgi:hypothetical protein
VDNGLNCAKSGLTLSDEVRNRCENLNPTQGGDYEPAFNVKAHVVLQPHTVVVPIPANYLPASRPDPLAPPVM